MYSDEMERACKFVRKQSFWRRRDTPLGIRAWHTTRYTRILLYFVHYLTILTKNIQLQKLAPFASSDQKEPCISPKILHLMTIVEIISEMYIKAWEGKQV